MAEAQIPHLQDTENERLIRKVQNICGYQKKTEGLFEVPVPVQLFHQQDAIVKDLNGQYYLDVQMANEDEDVIARFDYGKSSTEFSQF